MPRSPECDERILVVHRSLGDEETVSKFEIRSKSCHDLGSHVLRFPHPNPLPEGEGAAYSRCTIPSPLGRGTQGEGNRATMSAILRVLRQFLNRLATFNRPYGAPERNKINNPSLINVQQSKRTWV
jgi:hypothetical protein